MVGVSRKNHRAARANHLLNQKQNPIKGKSEIKTVHPAMHIHHVTRFETEVTRKNICEFVFSEWRQRSDAAAFLLPLGAPELRHCAGGQDCLGNSLQTHFPKRSESSRRPTNNPRQSR